MIGALFLLVCIIVGCTFLALPLVDAMVNGSKLAVVGLVVLFTLMLVLPVWLLGQGETRPCVRYTTTMVYNPAPMPVQVCAEWGEWVVQEP